MTTVASALPFLGAAVAERDSSLRGLYADLVREQPGYRLVGEVGSGDSLFPFLGRETPHLVLLDLSLPGLGGLEGFRTLRSEHPRLDWIVLVRGEDPDGIRGVVCLGAFDCLIRPFPSSRLRAALTAYRTFHRELVSRRAPWRQEELDRLVGLRRESATPEPVCPKGLQPQLLERVQGLLKECPRGLSAAEAGARLGLGRSTTRRYLEFLSENGWVSVEYDSVPVGRPSKRYRMA
jgi:two-component system response regulator DctR